MNDTGHTQLTEASRWSEVKIPYDGDAVKKRYCTTEVGAVTEETEACGWWSLGSVLFELLPSKTRVDCPAVGVNAHTTSNMPDECISE